MKKILELRYNDSNDTVELHYRDCIELDNFVQGRVLPKDRCWSKELRCWVVLPDVLVEIAIVAASHFDDVRYFSLPNRLQNLVQAALSSNNFTPKSEMNTDSNLHSLYLTEDAPKFLVKAVYKALAKRYHPDNQKTGDEDEFKRVSEIYESLGRL